MNNTKHDIKCFEGKSTINKISKCDFCMKEVLLLGHIISKYGVTVYLAKVTAVKEWKHNR